MSRHRSSCLLLLVSILLMLGCTAKLQELHVASGFDWTKLSSGNAVVLGLSSTTAGVSDSLLPALRATVMWSSRR